MNELEQFILKLERDLGLSKGGSVMKAADPLITTVMDNASLRHEMATKFINQVVNESVLLKAVRRHMTNAPSGDITKLRITTHVTEGANENADSGNTRRPSDAVLQYVTKKTRSALDISGEWAEDNIEGAGGVNTVMRAFVDQIANDMEVLAIEGDEAQQGSDDYSRLVKVNDGWHQLTGTDTDTHQVDAGGKEASYWLLSEMLRAMPTKWKRNTSNLRWIMSWGAAQSLIDEFAKRETAYGDQIRQSGVVPPFLSIPTLVVPLLPEDLSFSGTHGTTGSFIWLADPKNFIFVVQRDMRIERERRARYDREEFTIFMRTDFLVEETDAVVRANNVSVWTEHDHYGESST